MEKLKLASSTVVQQSLGTLEGVKELQAALQQEGKQGAEPKARPPLAMELEQGMLERSLRGGAQRWRLLSPPIPALGSHRLTAALSPSAW